VTTHDGLEVLTFDDRAELRAWLTSNHASHPGLWVRVARSGSSRRSVTFAELLEEGLCFGWSESTRHAGDDDGYLQRFTPRRGRGTASERNRRLVERLGAEGRMTAAGYRALGLPVPPGSGTA
jgi:uncharacterized protein YdeI (YjbR/CyaY-like superfamily)